MSFAIHNVYKTAHSHSTGYENKFANQTQLVKDRINCGREMRKTIIISIELRLKLKHKKKECLKVQLTPKIKIEAEEKKLNYVSEIDAVEDENITLFADLIVEKLVNQRREADQRMQYVIDVRRDKHFSVFRN